LTKGSWPPEFPKYVALKIFGGAESNEEHRCNEELCLRKLMQGRQHESPGRGNVLELFDAFDIESHNGIHRCLVLDVVGQDFVELAEVKSYGFNDAIYIFKQCVEAIEYLHSMGISHGG
jgi:serine/threonine-protein kinase SRPK3